MTTIPGPDLPPGTVVEHRPADGAVWEFRDRRIEGVTFRRITDGAEWMSFERVVFVDCTFEDCDLQWEWGSHHERQDGAAHLVGCRVVGCDLRNTSLAFGRIERCTFDRCQWLWPLTAVDLVDNVFLGVVESLTIWGRDVPPADVIQPRARRNELRGNDFRRADLRGLGLQGEVPVRDQHWPDGPMCAIVDRIPERVAAIRERTASSQDPVDRELHESTRWWAFTNEAEARQSEAWLRWDDPLMPDFANRFNLALAQTPLD